MKFREKITRGMAIFMVVTVSMYYVFDAGAIDANADEVILTDDVLEEEIKQNDDLDLSVDEAEAKDENKTYIVKTKNERTMDLIQEKYSQSDEINDNAEGNLEENNLLSVELSEEQVERLEENKNIDFLEEDYEIAGCRNDKNKKKKVKKKKHSKKENRLMTNDSKYEWNVRMIQAEEKFADTKDHVKVAVIDSGIDWGNDINLVYQVSLVPGEEDMTQIFMDDSGHGSSVASLIAANDDGNGITGINPYVDIYSYRVLAEGNSSPVSRVVEAIYMAIDQGVQIINMSFGLNEYSEALKQAVRDAKKAGILIIAAAGNTGEEGVQYPAAFEEVMAVGAVNKFGTVEDYSSKGEEVEIVAPGELVRTTGFIGSEEVLSGTSLAAPQVTAIASLIWQKDLSVSADFVRGLLDESANLYGAAASYGHGLVDAKYALDHYNEYKNKYNNMNNYEEEKALISDNQSEIITFQDTGCVEGSWYGDDHAAMIASSKYCVRAGVRFPDTDGGHGIGNSYFQDGWFNHMTVNPWWHGYYETNYIKAAMYAAHMADAVGNGKSFRNASPLLGYEATKQMEDGIQILYNDKERGWKEILAYVRKNGGKNQNNTNGFKRAVMWGMAIHTATDTYAHSAAVHGAWIEHVKNHSSKVPDADNKDYILWRYKDASAVAGQMMEQYNNKAALTARDLMMPGSYTIGYELIYFNDYIKSVNGSLNYSYRYPSWK